MPGPSPDPFSRGASGGQDAARWGGVFVSLRWRLVAPLLALWAVGMVLLVSVVYASSVERFQTLVEERADGIVAAVCSVAETARDPTDLRRFL